MATLTDEDIQKITNAQIEAQKKIFFTKEEMDEKFYSKTDMDTKFSNLQIPIDAIVKEKVTNDQDRLVANTRIKNVEDFLDKVAKKLELEFKH